MSRRSAAERLLKRFSDSRKSLEAKTLYNGERGMLTEYTEGGETVALRFEYPDGRIELRQITHDHTKDFRG